MKKLFFCAIIAALSVVFTNQSYAQYGDNRNKIAMTITAGGKSVSADLNAVSTSISRNTYDSALDAPKDSAAGKKVVAPSAEMGKTTFYLSMDVKSIEPALLQILAKKNTPFDGTITITDSYGKNPNRKITFKQGALYSYSDNFSSASYDGGYGNISLSVMCTGMTIDGVTVE